MHCDPTLQRERGSRSVGEGSFQPKEGASPSGQLDSFIAPCKRKEAEVCENRHVRHHAPR